jgi:DNA-binding transcriptional regulator YiaG
MNWTPETIKALRKHMDINQAELATLVGSHEHIIAQWEKGETSPSWIAGRTLEGIARDVGFEAEQVSG